MKHRGVVRVQYPNGKHVEFAAYEFKRMLQAHAEGRIVPPPPRKTSAVDDGCDDPVDCDAREQEARAQAWSKRHGKPAEEYWTADLREETEAHGARIEVK